MTDNRFIAFLSTQTSSFPTLGKSWVIFRMFCPFLPMINLWSHRGASTSAEITLLAFSYTCVKALPSLSGSPRKVMVSRSLSRGGISTETPDELMLTKSKAEYKLESQLSSLITPFHKVISTKAVHQSIKKLQAPVWKVDNALHSINCYPVEEGKQNKTRYPLDRDLSSG